MTCVLNSRRAARALTVAAIIITSSCAAIAQERVAQGREIAFDRSKGNCLSCHAIQGGDLPGTIGPALEGIKARFPNRSDLVAIIHDETKRNPQTVMPPFGRNLILNDAETQAVVDFLYTL
jgi:sulfur-oxidizing protein SoxX